MAGKILVPGRTVASDSVSIPLEQYETWKAFQVFETLKHMVLLCIPFGEVIFGDTFGYLAAIIQKGWLLHYRGGGSITVHRNEFAMELLKHPTCEYLVMLDQDHAHPADIVERLMMHALQDREKKIISGLNYRRGVPYEPMAYIRHGDKHCRYEGEFDGESLYSVDAVATCAMLVHRSVFETIPGPWFEDNYKRYAEHVFSGEDLDFCRKARNAGFKIWVDSSLTSPHRTTCWVDKAFYDAWREANEMPEETS